jgi:hypothetical protein
MSKALADLNPLRELTLPGRIPRFRGGGDWSIEKMSEQFGHRRGPQISRGATI